MLCVCLCLCLCLHGLLQGLVRFFLLCAIPLHHPPPFSSPQIVVSEASKPLYHFLTTTCAIVGGVFTVAGILDSILYQSVKMIKKNQLGKQG